MQLVGRDGKDKLSKFVHGATNDPAARKAVELLEKCGIKGVGTRGLFMDKVKSVVMGIIIWRMLQEYPLRGTSIQNEKATMICPWLGLILYVHLPFPAQVLLARLPCWRWHL